MTRLQLSTPFLLVLLLQPGTPAIGGEAQDTELAPIIEQIAQGNHDAAIAALEGLRQSAPSESVYYYLGNLYRQENNLEKAIAAGEEGTTKFPLSGRLHNGLALAYEQKFELVKAVRQYRKANALDPTLVNVGGGRYDAGFNAVYIPVVHDHRGANSCSGRLYVEEQKLHFVVYIVASGLGPGNDDSFESTLANIDYVEVDRKRGQLLVDYSVITLITNMSSARRRIGSGEESRIDLKFVFKQPIKGYRGTPWSKEDIKFFFVEPEIGDSYLKFLEARGVKITQRPS